MTPDNICSYTCLFPLLSDPPNLTYHISDYQNYPPFSNFLSLHTMESLSPHYTFPKTLNCSPDLSPSKIMLLSAFYTPKLPCSPIFSVHVQTNLRADFPQQAS